MAPSLEGKEAAITIPQAKWNSAMVEKIYTDLVKYYPTNFAVELNRSF
jgi:hypothetical protein